MRGLLWAGIVAFVLWPEAIAALAVAVPVALLVLAAMLLIGEPEGM